MNKAARIVRQLEVRQLDIGGSPCCPSCGRRNYCSLHNYAYRQWLKNTLPYLQTEASIRG
jgi:hypothetical protein